MQVLHTSVFEHVAPASPLAMKLATCTEMKPNTSLEGQGSNLEVLCYSRIRGGAPAPRRGAARCGSVPALCRLQSCILSFSSTL